jgi:lipoyl(octanoyl) transferase
MIQYLYLGRVGYDEALRLQEELVLLRQQDRIGNVLLLLEHPPVLTLGRNANRSNVLASSEMLAARGVTLHEINRGGDVTYHGPGQLIGYPIFDLRSLRSPNGGRLGPVDFVRLMEEALIRLCGEFGVPTGRICGLTGVWCGVLPVDGASRCDPTVQNSSKGLQPGGRERKIAAIGIHVARGVTSHGFAFNVTTDLRDFTLINPCGITDRPVTSLEKELAREVADAKSILSLESIAQQAARQFGQVFNEQVLALANLAALRAQAQSRGPQRQPFVVGVEARGPQRQSFVVGVEAAPAGELGTPAPDFPAPVFPAQDTLLRLPPEIERLRHSKDRPIPT